MSLDEKQQGDHRIENALVDIDLATFHEKNAGRLVIDPACVILIYKSIHRLTCPTQRSQSRIRRRIRISSKTLQRWNKNPLASAVRLTK